MDDAMMQVIDRYWVCGAESEFTNEMPMNVFTNSK